MSTSKSLHSNSSTTCSSGYSTSTSLNISSTIQNILPPIISISVPDEDKNCSKTGTELSRTSRNPCETSTVSFHEPAEIPDFEPNESAKLTQNPQNQSQIEPHVNPSSSQFMTDTLKVDQRRGSDQKSDRTSRMNEVLQHIETAADKLSYFDRLEKRIKKNLKVKKLIHFFDTGSWMKCFVVLVFLYISPCLLFAFVYCLLDKFHILMSQADDLVKHEADRLNVTMSDPFCISNTRKSIEYLQFSFETQSTIGYGHHYPEDRCLEITFLGWMQCMMMNGILTPVFASLCFKKMGSKKEHEEETALHNEQQQVKDLIATVEKMAKQLEEAIAIKSGNKGNEEESKRLLDTDSIA